jgi:hypothetical protein
MNADLKRVRDGGLEETGSPLSKKRILSPTSAQGPSSPSAEDDNGGMEDWMKEVEVSLTSIAEERAFGVVLETTTLNGCYQDLFINHTVNKFNADTCYSPDVKKQSTVRCSSTDAPSRPSRGGQNS